MPTLLCSRLRAVAFAATVLCCAPAAASARTDPHEPAHAHRTARTLGQRAAAIAVKEVGVPYHWGGASPSSGFDCSGLVFWTYERLGLELPHSSYALYDRGRPVARSRMRAGDLLFFYGLGHVGIYIGRGRMVHAPHSGSNVQIVSLGSSGYAAGLVGVRRIVR